MDYNSINMNLTLALQKKIFLRKHSTFSYLPVHISPLKYKLLQHFTVPLLSLKHKLHSH